MKNFFIEGPRGTGKSTICRALRDEMTETILIDHTGLNRGKEELQEQDELDKYFSDIVGYYEGVGEFMRGGAKPFTVIHDRSPISELIYGPLYKEIEYSDKTAYQLLVTMRDSIVIRLVDNFPESKIKYRRESGGKGELFGKIADTLNEIGKQSKAYDEFFKKFNAKRLWNLNIQLVTVDVTYLSKEIAYSKVRDIIYKAIE